MIPDPVVGWGTGRHDGYGVVVSGDRSDETTTSPAAVPGVRRAGRAPSSGRGPAPRSGGPYAEADPR